MTAASSCHCRRPSRRNRSCSPLGLRQDRAARSPRRATFLPGSPSLSPTSPLPLFSLPCTRERHGRQARQTPPPGTPSGAPSTRAAPDPVPPSVPPRTVPPSAPPRIRFPTQRCPALRRLTAAFSPGPLHRCSRCSRVGAAMFSIQSDLARGTGHPLFPVLAGGVTYSSIWC